LKIKNYFPKSRPIERPKGLEQRAPAVSGSLLSMLLKGGCGYEEPQSRSLLADERRL
jgi:hypothetical protein